jgi:thiol-disulfide isomerase/thioredoxin
MNPPARTVILSVILLLAVIPVSPAGAFAPTAERPFPLLVGDQVPPLTVSRWVKGEPMERFEPGRVYVVDLWASWCGPCIASFPHLSALRKRYVDDVTVVSVNILEVRPGAVPDFVRQQGGRMAFSVAMDSIPDGKQANEGLMAANWLYGAGEEGIPNSYVIDRKGRLAWEGHPMAMDSVLAAVVDGSWDVDAWAAQTIEGKRKIARGFHLKQDLDRAIVGSEWDRVWAVADTLAGLNDGEYAPDAARELSVAASMLLNKADVPSAEADRALRFATRGNELTGGKDPWSLGVLGQVHARLGHVDQAKKLIEQALEAAPDRQKGYYRKLLDQLNGGK